MLTLSITCKVECEQNEHIIFYKLNVKICQNLFKVYCLQTSKKTF